MADFVAVLRKAISNLGENTPEMREKVYDKARSTIETKLAAINPPPPAAVMERQRKALEDAIAVVRADYAEKEAAVEDDELEDIFASLHEQPDVTPPPAPQPAPRETVAPAPIPPAPEKLDPVVSEPFATVPAASEEPVSEPVAEQASPASRAGEGLDTLLADPAPQQERERVSPTFPTGEKRSKGKLVGVAAAALIAVAAAAGIGYVLTKDSDQPQLATETENGQPTADAPAAPAEEEVAAAPEAPAPETSEEAEAEKFTQRLLPDGSEVDDGPAGEQPTIGEGTSVATLQQPAGNQPPAQGAPNNGSAPANSDASGQQSGVAVGQRAIFYEERTSSAQGSAELGNIVWSLVQESPGGDLAPEPAIRAEAAIPGMDVQLRMTIRRNGDTTLPASHIVEMIFLTPEGFEGGTISNVSRMSFKETEQAPGSPLIGIPAKIADGFFLIALGDAPAEIQANTTLLRQQSWIDIPIVYQSGRRALLSLEKGLPGDRVFKEALQAWEQATAG